LSGPELERAFEVFYQGESATDRKRGVGIGLSLVQRLAKLHRGSVAAASAGPAQAAHLLTTDGAASITPDGAPLLTTGVGRVRPEATRTRPGANAQPTEGGVRQAGAET
jgi:signal transduction histidine kinase